MTNIFRIALATILFMHCEIAASAQVKQKNISRVDQMPFLAKPLQIIDYKKLALRFDSTVYDFNAKGKFWPLVWIDSSMKNFPQPVVGLYTEIGDTRQGPENNNGIFHKGRATLGGVLGTTLVGIDNRNSQNLDLLGIRKK